MFEVEIILPDKIFLKKKVNSVIVPGYEGYLGILKNHAPFICELKEGKIVIKNDEEERTFKINNGILKVQNNRVIILTEEIWSI